MHNRFGLGLVETAHKPCSILFLCNRGLMIRWGIRRPDFGSYDERIDPHLNYSDISCMQHFTISAEDVHRQLINLNPRKSEDADEIHPRILTSLARYLAAPLAKLSNNSFEICIIAVEWKSAIICPIYNNDVANYRPICLTFVACKTLERISKAHILQSLKISFLFHEASMDSCLDVRV